MNIHGGTKSLLGIGEVRVSNLDVVVEFWGEVVVSIFGNVVILSF